MKTNQKTATAAAMIAIGISTTILCGQTQSRIPAIPVGSLSASPTLVRTGTHPTLTWNILYPSKVSDVVTVNPNGTIMSSGSVYVSVQPIGNGITNCTPSDGSASLYVDARVSFNGSAYSQIFYGTMTDVDPAHRLYIKKMAKNDILDFGGRYVKNGAWSPFYTSRSGNLQIVALVDGDTPPTRFSLAQSSTLASYLKPYINPAGKVTVGPMSVLIMMELGYTNHDAKCFDYQDQVLLVTFSTKHPNNGHGNNLDGVDSSNPGQGSGGPNGAVDPSAGVDDEIK